MSIGDLITYLCLAIAIWYVPRYLLRVYAPGVYARLHYAWQDAVQAAQERSVKRSLENAPHTPHVMSRQEVQTQQTDATDARVSEAEQWIARMRVDRTKATLISICAYTGWTVPEIRAALKGDNNVLGVEIEAARTRLGIAPPAPHVTPYVGRPTNARFETDPDYPYQAPA